MALDRDAVLARIDKLLEVDAPKQGDRFDVSGEIFMGALSVASVLYGPSSPQVQAIRECKDRVASKSKLRYYDQARATTEEVRGMLAGMRDDLEAGLIETLQAEVAGEVFADFVVMAKESAESGAKDVAAVLACAALEDALKKRGEIAGLDVDGKSMSEVIAALKSEGVIRGPRAKLLGSFVTIRNKAFHASWDAIDLTEVRSVIAFVEAFLLSEFQQQAGREA